LHKLSTKVRVEILELDEGKDAHGISQSIQTLSQALLRSQELTDGAAMDEPARRNHSGLSDDGDVVPRRRSRPRGEPDDTA